MSTPDARLSAAERAALAHLESAATAADPHLAARLKGRPPSRLVPVVHAGRARLLRSWSWLLARCWWGGPMVVAGLVLILLGLGSGGVISGIGVVITLIGLRLVAEMVERRLAVGPRARHSPPAG